MRDALIALSRRDPPAALPRLAPEEWSELVDLATRLGVAGHVHAALAVDVAHGGAPSEAWAKLTSAYYAFGARNALLLTTLAEVLTALRTRGIAVIVLKGAALVETVYGNLARRTMHDLDLLVHPADATAAGEVLEALGFTPDEWYRPREWYVANLHHLVPFKRDGITVEIHHHLLAPTVPQVIPEEQLWTRAQPATIAGAGALVLAPEELLVHLVLHLVLANRWVGGLSAMRDIAEVIERHRGSLDWERVVASSAPAARAMYAGLNASRHLAGAEVPAHVLAALRARGGVSALESRAIVSTARVLALDMDDRGLVPTWLWAEWAMQLIERRAWTARALEVMRRALSNSDEAGARGEDRHAEQPTRFMQRWRGLLRRVRSR